MKTLTVYGCDFCNRLFKTAKGAVKHEANLCYHNPDTKSCFTCGLFVSENNGPHCEEHHDSYYEALDGTTRCDGFPLIQRECGMWKPREDYPGEYIKFKTGNGGFRRVYLPEESEE